MALTRSCGRLTVATFLALLMGQKVATVEQRLSAWCCPAAHKAGGTRQTVDVTTCFMPLLRGGVAWWASTHMALARDATSVGARCVVLTVRVVYRGGAMPVAWTVWPANPPGAWRREWRRRLRQVRPAIPADGSVLVLADRGVWARGLFGRLVQLGGHPLLRLTQGATCRPAGPPRWYWLRALVGDIGQSWRGRGTAFVSPERRVDCTLLAWGGRGRHRPVVAADRPGPGGWRRPVVWAAGVGRTGGQMLQARRVAGAIYAEERARSGGPPLAGRGGGHLVAGAGRGGVGGRPRARGHGPARSAALVGAHSDDGRPTATPPGAAPGLVVVPGVSEHHGQPAPAAALRPRALAGYPWGSTGDDVPAARLGMQ